MNINKHRKITFEYLTKLFHPFPFPNKMTWSWHWSRSRADGIIHCNSHCSWSIWWKKNLSTSIAGEWCLSSLSYSRVVSSWHSGAGGGGVELQEIKCRTLYRAEVHYYMALPPTHSLAPPPTLYNTSWTPLPHWWYVIWRSFIQHFHGTCDSDIGLSYLCPLLLLQRVSRNVYDAWLLLLRIVLFM